MKDKLAELQNARKSVALLERTVEQAQLALEQAEEYKTLQYFKERLTETKTRTDEMADEIRTEAIMQFDGENKKPYDGIQIKEFQTIEVTDEEEAIKWSIDSGQFALVSLVTSKFNKIAKVLDLPFVTKGTEYRAQIASDLSMYEEKDE